MLAPPQRADASRPRTRIDADGTVEGYASLFGVIDSARDMIMPGAFARTLALRGVRLIPDVQRSREVLALIRAGALDGLSIGFRTTRARVDPVTRVRKLSDVELWEISVVTFPLLDGARVLSRSPDGAKRNPGLEPSARSVPHSASLHAGYGRCRHPILTAPARIFPPGRIVRIAPLAKYSPDQPRLPAGNPDGGQWTDGGGGGVRNRPEARRPSDEVSAARKRPGGHHYIPKSLYRDLNLPSETRKVLDGATTGPLRAEHHGWSKDHGRYNAAVSSALDRFMEARNISPERMTPDHAREFIGEIKRSPDPRIREFNTNILRREFRFLLRFGPRRID